MFENQIAEQKAAENRKVLGVFSPKTVRAAAVGAAIGLALFLFLHFAFGRPDSYIEKALLLVGGGAAAGALVGIVRGTKQPPD
jgi:hypothetical protein